VRALAPAGVAAASFPVEKIRDAVELLAGRHVHGKIVVTM